MKKNTKPGKIEQREVLFSLTRKNFHFDTFRAGGKGGQAQNKKSTGVRCVHPPSGATGEARDTRSQYQNKRNAWLRCIETQTFRTWIRLEVARASVTQQEIERWVNQQMHSSNLEIEYWDGVRWQRDPPNAS